MALTRNEKIIIVAAAMQEEAGIQGAQMQQVLQYFSKRHTNVQLLPILTLRESHQRIPHFETWLSRYLNSDFYALFRMERQTFEVLLNDVEGLTRSKHTAGRTAVATETKLLVTLWYLAKGETLISISDRFNLSQSKTWECVDEILSILNQMLPKYIVWPTEEECNAIVGQFNERGNYPGIVGAIDCTHINCKIPEEQHTSYQDRKFNHSITIQDIATSSKLFTDVSIGYPGCLHDARILKESAFGGSMYNNIYNYVYRENWHIIEDSAYPCKIWLMTPFRDNGRLTRTEKRHNTYLSSSRVCIEHAFGLLKG